MGQASLASSGAVAAEDEGRSGRRWFASCLWIFFEGANECTGRTKTNISRALQQFPPQEDQDSVELRHRLT